MPNTSKGVEIDPVRENLVELLKSTPIAEINGHIAKADVCFVSHVFESFGDHLIANGVTVQKWISVNDRLPDDDIPSTSYLCYWRSHTQICKYSRTRKCFEFNGRLINVTHWMPLPSTEGLK